MAVEKCNGCKHFVKKACKRSPPITPGLFSQYPDVFGDKEWCKELIK